MTLPIPISNIDLYMNYLNGNGNLEDLPQINEYSSRVDRYLFNLCINRYLTEIQIQDISKQVLGTKTSGFRYVANKVATSRVQPAFLFNLAGSGYAIGDVFKFSAIIRTNDSNVLRIEKTENFFNAIATLVNATGTNIAGNGSNIVVGTDLNFVSTFTATEASSTYLHVFIDFMLNNLTLPIDFSILNVKLTRNGVTVPQVTAAGTGSTGLFLQNFTDGIGIVSRLNEDIPSTYYANKNNRLYGKIFNALGDSITNGYLLANPATEAWRNIIGSRNSMVVRNHGSNGSTLSGTTGSMVERALTMSTNADYITVWGGTNDYSANVPLGLVTDVVATTFYGALNILCKYIKETYPKGKVGFITPLNHKTIANGIGLFVQDYVNAIKTICNLWGIKVLDLYHEGQVLPINAVHLATLMADYQHPNATGNVLIADTVESFMMSL